MSAERHLYRQHAELRAKVRSFATTEVAPRVAAMENSDSVEHALVQRIAASGWIGVTIPPEYGGMGAGHLAKTIIVEELSRVSPAMGAAAQASQLGVAKLLTFGTPAQKRKWLPQFADGSCLPTIATTEPGSGSHVLGMKTAALRDGNSYVLTGTKAHIGNSHVAGVHGVIARTGEGSHGLTAFLVPAGTPGLTLEPHRPRTALRGFSYGTLRFDACRIPRSHRIGREGDGLAVAYSSSVLYGRPNLAAVALGIHQAILEHTTRFVEERELYGSPLHALGTIRQSLGSIKSRVMTARLTAYEAAGMLDAGKPCDADLINSKLVGVTGLLDSARDAMEIHAGDALYADHPIGRLQRDAWATFAPAGTSHIQRLRLAEESLDLTKSQWSARYPSPLPKVVAT